MRISRITLLWSGLFAVLAIALATVASTEDAPHILFYHVPKCGGSTLKDVIKRAGAASRKAAHVQARVSDEFRRCDIGAHPSHFGFACLKPMHFVDAYNVTLLRDPIARVASLYSYLSESSGNPGHRVVTQHSFDELITRDFTEGMLRARIFSPVYDEYFSCEHGAAEYVLQTHFSVVGLLEHFAETLELLDCVFPQLNTRAFLSSHLRGSNAHPNVSESSRAVLRSVLARDYDVYRFAERRFWDQLRQCRERHRKEQQKTAT